MIFIAKGIRQYLSLKLFKKRAGSSANRPSMCYSTFRSTMPREITLINNDVKPYILQVRFLTDTKNIHPFHGTGLAYKNKQYSRSIYTKGDVIPVKKS